MRPRVTHRHHKPSNTCTRILTAAPLGCRPAQVEQRARHYYYYYTRTSMGALRLTRALPCSGLVMRTQRNKQTSVYPHAEVGVHETASLSLRPSQQQGVVAAPVIVIKTSCLSHQSFNCNGTGCWWRGLVRGPVVSRVSPAHPKQTDEPRPALPVCCCLAARPATQQVPRQNTTLPKQRSTTPHTAV